MKTISEIAEYLRNLSKEHYGDTSAIDDIEDWIDLRFFYPEMTLEGNAILLNKCRDFVKSHFNDNSFGRENTVHDMHSFILDNQFSQVGQSAPDQEPAYKKIPFDLAYALAHRDSVYTETGKKVENLTWFNLGTAFDVAGVVDDELLVFSDEGEYEGGDENYDLVLRKPVKRIKKQGWVNVYRLSIYKSGYKTGFGVYDTKEEALKEATPESVVDTVQIEWEEEE